MAWDSRVTWKRKKTFLNKPSQWFLTLISLHVVLPSNQVTIFPLNNSTFIIESNKDIGVHYCSKYMSFANLT